MTNQINTNTCTKDNCEEICGFPEKVQRPYVESLNNIGLNKYFCMDCLLAEVDPILRAELMVTENMVNSMRGAFSKHPEMIENEHVMTQYTQMLKFWEKLEISARKKVKAYAARPENFQNICRILVDLEGKTEKHDELKTNQNNQNS